MASAILPPAQGVPEGYRTAPLRPRDTNSPLRVALVVQEKPDATFGPFIRLRDVADGSVFLGCLEDFGGHLHRWLEVWVQHTENLGATRPGYSAALSNQALDARWGAAARHAAAVDPDGVIITGWETAHPLPLIFDAASGSFFNPTDAATSAPWELCTDDSRLMTAGLPPYSTSLARYLVMNDGSGDRFAPVTSDSPSNQHTISAAELFGGMMVFNPGGLMMLRFLAPLDFEEWIEVLAGEPWNGLPRGRRPVRIGGVYAMLGDTSRIRNGGGHFLLGGRGVGGRLIETCHLKLQALAAAFRAVEAAIQATQLPFLNLSSASFGVGLQTLDSDLPFLWSSRTSLMVPGDAVALPIETTEARYFVPSDFGNASIYRPAAAGLPVKGNGEFRIRKVLPDSGETTRIEASLVTQERMTASGNDLLWINLPLPSGHVAMYGHVDAAAATGGEIRFYGVPQKLSETIVAALRQAEGTPYPNVQFDLVPLLSSPCDLYALGVLAVRTLLVDGDNTLPIALDEVLSLARLLASQQGSPGSLGERMMQAAATDSRWHHLLGPHRMMREAITPEDALSAFPPTLWWNIIAWLVRLFPGVTPESYCRDYADAPSLALEKVFEGPRAELDHLLLHSRSVIVSDVHSHREMRAVIATFLAPQ